MRASMLMMPPGSCITGVKSKSLALWCLQSPDVAIGDLGQAGAGLNVRTKTPTSCKESRLRGNDEFPLKDDVTVLTASV